MTPDQMTELAARLRAMTTATKLDEYDIKTAAALIESMAQAEPVGWMWQHDETGRVGFVDQWNLDNGWANQNPRCRIVGAIYSAPPAREPLSEKQIERVRDNCVVTPAEFAGRRYGWAINFARAIEQAHGIRSEK